MSLVIYVKIIDKLITVIDNSVKKELSNLEIPTSLKNESSIDKTPKTDSSQVHTDRLRCLKRSVTFSFRCLYLFILKDFNEYLFSYYILNIIFFHRVSNSGYLDVPVNILSLRHSGIQLIVVFLRNNVLVALLIVIVIYNLYVNMCIYIFSHYRLPIVS